MEHGRESGRSTAAATINTTTIITFDGTDEKERRRSPPAREGINIRGREAGGEEKEREIGEQETKRLRGVVDCMGFLRNQGVM